VTERGPQPFLQSSLRKQAWSNSTLPPSGPGLLPLDGEGQEGVHSMIEDERLEWSTGAAQITPPAGLHSHRDRGAERMTSPVIQDEGLHLYTRSPGFAWG